MKCDIPGCRETEKLGFWYSENQNLIINGHKRTNPLTLCPHHYPQFGGCLRLPFKLVVIKPRVKERSYEAK